MQKHVRPAQAGAIIPDPERGDDLPNAGRTVAWTPYWARLEITCDIVVGEPGPEPAAEPEAAPQA